MAGAITSYLDLARSMLSKGTSLLEVFGPDRPNVELMFRQRQSGDDHSVCHFASELSLGVKGVEFPVKLATMFMFTYLMRVCSGESRFCGTDADSLQWMILASSENYAKIPDMYKPTSSQTHVPHSAAVEFCPLAPLRDALCHSFRDFPAMLAGSISCNWPYNDPHSCVEKDPNNGRLVLTDAFCIHVMTLDNWSVRPAMLDDFPECRGLLKVAY